MSRPYVGRGRQSGYNAFFRGFMIFTLLCVASIAQSNSDMEKPSVRIFAAASLTDALNKAIARYESQNEVDIVPVYASSSTAARQIASGAAADLFFSASSEWMNWLAGQGIELDERADIVQNRLALIAPSGREHASFTPVDGETLSSSLSGRERLSVGDPDHVPAGIYAKQALQSLDEWKTLQPRLARADNVRAALALVERGEVPLGIVYQTDAQASNRVRQLGLFPSDSHDPILYPLALVNPPASGAARDFRQWLHGDEALAIFSEVGFFPAAAVSR
ncbi:molybdate ABC transporter substrate-binding protein [Halomonas sp. M20]|uniref:molybdate ABC transporter substrate-binding protein n=1 Tax=Halomonas sp. M20 TaxID=2763264 RepID=UPI001D0A8EFE|nr:molybdate ABC transporter substrate-binding protein [Halomonas sp. M20]